MRTNHSFLLVVMTQILCMQSQAQDINYPVSEIPDSLLKNAQAVIRNEATIVTIQDNTDLKLDETLVITVLNESAKDLAGLSIYYDSFTKADFDHSSIYDKDGKLVKKIKSSDLYDHSEVSDFSLYEDARAKSYEFNSNNFPYTVEYHYSISQHGITGLPAFYVAPDFGVSVMKSSLTVNTNRPPAFRYKMKNGKNEPKISGNNSNATYEWDFENFPAMVKEEYAPSFASLVPCVLLASNELNVDNYSGKAETWNDLGSFFYKFINGTDELSSDVVSEVQQLTADAKTTREKTKLIYEYMQNKTRYVNIVLGVGGWKPFPAMTVNKNGYGDCKALSNYMRALLHAVGINAYYTLVNSGFPPKDIELDFPSNQFNHVILCVPDQADTIWLECTSQQIPFGFLGDFTCNRHALLVTPNGGFIVKTPCYNEKTNEQKRFLTVKYDEDGSMSAQATSTFSGLVYDEIFGLLYMPNDEQRKALTTNLPVKNLKLNTFSFSQNRNIIPTVTETLDFSADQFAAHGGSRLFIPLNILDKSETHPLKNANRKFDIVQHTGLNNYDSVICSIPAAYSIEFLPPAVSIKSEFGEYDSFAKSNGNEITYVRKLIIYEGEFPAKDYSAFIDFNQKVMSADNAKVSLLRN